MSITGHCYYEAARNEIVMRLRLRDQILLSFIISSAALLGLALSKTDGSFETIALAVPFLASGACILVAAHSCQITNLGLYVDELIPIINNCDENDGEILPWDSSKTFKAVCESSSLERFWGNFVIIVIPSFFALMIGRDSFIYPIVFPTDIYSTLWVVGLIQIFFHFVVLRKAHNYRISSLSNK